MGVANCGVRLREERPEQSRQLQQYLKQTLLINISAELTQYSSCFLSLKPRALNCSIKMASTAIPLKDRDTSVKPPTSTIVQHGRTGLDTIDSKSMGTFTGQVWLDIMLKDAQTTMVHVNFQPCARTNWHKHEGGQLIKVTAGSGWVCDQGEQPRKISVGDVIWCKFSSETSL